MGDNTDTKPKENIARGLFNRVLNKDGDFINLMLVNKKYSEGISLKHVRSVHLLEPPTSNSLREQIIGRAVRSCHHKGLEYPNDWKVEIYTYYATNDNLGVYNSTRYLSNNSEDDEEKEQYLESVSQTPLISKIDNLEMKNIQNEQQITIPIKNKEFEVETVPSAQEEFLEEISIDNHGQNINKSSDKYDSSNTTVDEDRKKSND